MALAEKGIARPEKVGGWSQTHISTDVLRGHNIVRAAVCEHHIASHSISIPPTSHRHQHYLGADFRRGRLTAARPNAGPLPGSAFSRVRRAHAFRVITVTFGTVASA